MSDLQQLSKPPDCDGAFDAETVTLDGKKRANVAFSHFSTLWFNTGTLCNIECAHCYIKSSPKNDALVYLNLEDIRPIIDELDKVEGTACEVGFTGGEPFMNPHFLPILKFLFKRGYSALILTNAMQPMQRKNVLNDLQELNRAYPDKICMRVSLDHYQAELHDQERGKGSFIKTVAGMDWLHRQGIELHIAGRQLWSEQESQTRKGYAGLIAKQSWDIDAFDPSKLIIFPEMDEKQRTPEISEGCWEITGVDPASLMCATSRMVVKKKGASNAQIQACTLIPYQESFNFGENLAASRRATSLNHPHCSKFCVLGGGSCSA